MNRQNRSVDQVTSHMANVLAKYLAPSEVSELTNLWRHQPAVSVKMLQQSILHTTKRCPQLKAYKSEIRKGFRAAIHKKTTIYKEADTYREAVRPLVASVAAIQQQPNAQQSSVKQSSSAQIESFYTVMENIKEHLSAPDDRNLFVNLHQNVRRKRTFKAYAIDIQIFLHNERPSVPDDVFILNNLVQLTYVCLCDVVGPVTADEVIYRSAENAKHHHPKALVENLF